ncbi:MAG: nucleotidyl transferase AbiEii/AbiGii toxin family protein [Rhodothermaceae bacterium]|nr:nucleotidyl transferase AbiEii/AbiGii toxin family protein [Rhodothermaceae bacterium]MXZ57977.1 nucleotidyl transferase AbiEii/AbiGii toxin family protein [Rhodothermaceae bacterium]MYB90966.1 nucleotidyl transferase AbiEii/AbiGii toxin family protein [Rhodothermaceae bacterium]MYD67669.1 nucleotidyl transferase AbiEii/AbiGii toxin family protein [Rhodothermaceae bacterium]MYG44536.1 nucleotidyl transferase AbiEii/AbiGii toxin family protein [Rhodothermaceae bacterium]
MLEAKYQTLSIDDQRDALSVAEFSSDQRAHLLEKDVWVVATLSALFNSPFSPQLTFKGGTSLSKVWGAIHRFSEDIDITYDIRALEPALVANAGEDVLPTTRSQVKRWSRAIRKDLEKWIKDEALPVVEAELSRAGFRARVHAESEKLYVGYESLFRGSGFLRPEVMVEFGARSTGEPHVIRTVECDAAAHLPGIIFPQTHVKVMRAERTFWEKATAIHVFCRQERRRGDRLSRHWYDLVRLDEAGIAERALSDYQLALSVARHKTMFFSAKDVSGKFIDYQDAVSGDLQLVPSGNAYEMLANDYAKMATDGMLLGKSEPFSVLMERCRLLEEKANSLRSGSE